MIAQEQIQKTKVIADDFTPAETKEIELNNTILLAKETGCTIKLDGFIRLKLIK
jgi:hypothetical protein